MFKVKIIVTPLFIFYILIRTEWIASLFCSAMPVLTVFLVGVIGRQVESTSKPPDRFRIRIFGNEKSHIRMRGRHVGIVRVDYQRNTHGPKITSGQLGAMSSCRGW